MYKKDKLKVLFEGIHVLKVSNTNIIALIVKKIQQVDSEINPIVHLCLKTCLFRCTQQNLQIKHVTKIYESRSYDNWSLAFYQEQSSDFIMEHSRIIQRMNELGSILPPFSGENA